MGFKGLFGGFLITRRFPDCTIPLLEDEVITRVLPCTAQAENIGIILRENSRHWNSVCTQTKLREAWVRERTMLAERPPFVDEVSANIWG
jgi:hypothetical protein